MIERLSLEQVTEQGLQNHLRLGFKAGKLERIWLDCTLFPLFCNHCCRSQRDLFHHLGSRYGQVGAPPCEFCGRQIIVTDHDNIVLEIMVNGHRCSFADLFILGLEEITWFEDWYEKSLSDYLPLDSLGRSDWLSVDDLREILEDLSGVRASQEKIYQTSSLFTPLPPDINRWLNFLDQSSYPLPSYITSR